MKTFAYHRPADVAAAAALLAATQDSIPIAGGMSLLPVMKFGLAEHVALVDLSGITALRGITVGSDDITIGAGTTHVEVTGSAEIAGAIPALAQLAGSIGDPQVRNRGTLGGVLANADPSADYPAAVVALNATIVTNQRRIAAGDFFVGLFGTALQPGEIITAVSFPIPLACGYAKFRSPASRYAIVGVFVARFADHVRLAVTGAGPSVFRVSEMERALEAAFSPDALAGMAISPDGLNGDIHAEPSYRAHLVGVMARRAVTAALPRA
ncbi:MAG TPA: xanthine dehydrogenase family protein subunit M [Rhodopila sp.]|jgi:carbon-monoxide dehydrogenase medium subunit|nr:xanthine dehydrogenase family protein subunit M [Rhodopila sp.]